jgi:hypothetical protein
LCFLLLVPATIAGLAFGCGDDTTTIASSAPDGGSTEDGSQRGSEGGLDPSVPAVPDATTDAALDAPSEADADAGSPSVTVHVFTKRGPVANVTVVFHDVDGSVLETKLTSADGKASSSGSTPAMATAVVPDGSGDQYVTTWTNVEAGDELSLEARVAPSRRSSFSKHAR